MAMFWLVPRMAELGISDKELAERLKISRSSISTWRWNEEIPSTFLGHPQRLNELAEALKMSPLEVLNASGYKIGYEVDGLHISHEIKEFVELLASAPASLQPIIIRIAIRMAKELIAELDDKEP